MKKILILYTSVGLGHKFIAENIGYHLTQAGFEVVLHDILVVEKGRLVEVGTWVHQWINLRTPWFWSWLYNSMWFSRLTMPLRTKVAGKHNSSTREVIERVKPDLVISTQTTASAAVAALKQDGVYTGLFAISFSDYHFHPYWYYKEADYYLVNIEEQAVELVKLGVLQEKIFVCGFAMMPKVAVDSPAIRLKLGIGASAKVILVGSGSLGTGFPQGFLDSLVAVIDKTGKDWRVVIVTGKNAAALARLTKRYSQRIVTVLGYYSPMRELFEIADVFITKPGGLSTAEALLYRVPILLSHWLPGQEVPNYLYLKRNKLILDYVGDPYDHKTWPAMIDAVVRELETGAFRKGFGPERTLSLEHAGNKIVTAVKQMFHSS